MIDRCRRYRKIFFQDIERKNSPFFVPQKAQKRDVMRFSEKSMDFRNPQLTLALPLTNDTSSKKKTSSLCISGRKKRERDKLV